MSHKLIDILGGNSATTVPDTTSTVPDTTPTEKPLSAYDAFGKTNSLIDQYGSNKFVYDPETDANFQAYLDLAKQNGKLAMQDTLAKASAMTGGYSNSNAQLAGQKVYNQYMTQANAAMGDYYAMALDAFNNEQNTLLNQIELAWAQQDRDWAQQDRQKADALLKAEYGDYSGLSGLGINQDAIDKYQGDADWATQYAKDSADFERAWQIAQATGDYYNALYNILPKFGYTDEQIDAIKNNVIDSEYANRSWEDKEYEVNPNIPEIQTDFFAKIINNADFEKNIPDELGSVIFWVDARSGQKYTFKEVVENLKSAGFTNDEIRDAILGSIDKLKSTWK